MHIYTTIFGKEILENLSIGDLLIRALNKCYFKTDATIIIQIWDFQSASSIMYRINTLHIC